MKDRAGTVALLVVLTATAGCGRSQDVQTRDDVGRAAGTASAVTVDVAGAAGEAGTRGPAPDERASGLESITAGLKTMANQPSDPVAFRELQGLFPDLEGWTKARPTGEQVSIGIKMSRAGVRYQRGDASMEMEITDSSLNQAMIAPLAMMLATGYEKESTRGFERSTKVGGQAGWEKWDSEEKGGELNAVVGKRFIVKIAASNVDDLTPLHLLADSANLARLAEMR